MSKGIIVNLQVEGIHHWATCNISEVNYLASVHRHIFHVRALKVVSHNDREVEFIEFKHNLEDYLVGRYYDEGRRLLDFGSLSCEDIAEELVNQFELAQCVVLEDGENGAIVLNDNIDQCSQTTSGGSARFSVNVKPFNYPKDPHD